MPRHDEHLWFPASPPICARQARFRSCCRHIFGTSVSRRAICSWLRGDTQGFIGINTPEVRLYAFWSEMATTGPDRPASSSAIRNCLGPLPFLFTFFFTFTRRSKNHYVGWETWGYQNPTPLLETLQQSTLQKHALDLGWGIRFGVGHYPVRGRKWLRT